MTIELLAKIDLLEKENQRLNKQLDYLRNGEYLNQLKFEVSMLEHIIENGEVSEEDKKIEKLKIKDGKITGNWGNGNYYCYTLSSPQAVIVNKLNELVDEVNKLKENE